MFETVKRNAGIIRAAKFKPACYGVGVSCVIKLRRADVPLRGINSSAASLVIIVRELPKKAASWKIEVGKFIPDNPRVMTALTFRSPTRRGRSA